MIRLTFAIPVWLITILLMIPCIILGAIFITLLALALPLTTVRRTSEKYASRTVLAWRWRWMWLWGNEEDGIDGCAHGFWLEPQGAFDRYVQIWDWSVWRNSVGNARWTPVFGCPADPKTCTTKFLSPTATLSEGPYFAWDRWHCELKFCWNPTQPDRWKRRCFWIGWQIAGHESPAADFKTQIASVLS